MPSSDAATSTPVLPRTAARPADPTGPERSAPPPNRVFADSGTSTPISNPVFLVSSPPGPYHLFCALRLPPRPPSLAPPVGSLTSAAARPEGQADHDGAQARACLS